MGHYRHYRIFAKVDLAFGEMLIKAVCGEDAKPTGQGEELTPQQVAVSTLADAFSYAGGNWKVDNYGVSTVHGNFGADRTSGDVEFSTRADHVQIDAYFSARSHKDLSAALTVLGEHVLCTAAAPILFAVTALEDIGSDWELWTSRVAVYADGHSVYSARKVEQSSCSRGEGDADIQSLPFSEAVVEYLARVMTESLTT